MMFISDRERDCIRMVLAAGREFGYGNMIAHLQTAWARKLMEEDGFPVAAARRAATGDAGYPFAMQDDLLHGFWDETGERYHNVDG